MILILLALTQSETLGGDWGGARKDLGEKGLSWQLLYTGEVLANVHGGLDTGAEYQVILDAYLDLDLHALLGWEGGAARLNAYWLAGEGVTEDYVGDLFRVSNIDAREALRVFEAWLQQRLFDAVTIRAGILAADTEFALIEAAYQFVNGAFGAPPVLSLNEPAPVYPLGALGAMAKAELGAGFVLRAALYEGSPDEEYLNESGLDVRLSDEEGVLYFGEAAWAGEGSAVKAGLFHHTGAVGESHTGVYAVVQQALWLGGPIAFGRAGFAEEDVGTLWKSLETGVSWIGPLAARPKDELLLGFVYGRLSREFAAAQPTPSDWRYESVVELSYRVHVVPGVVVQPDVQFVRHPGGTRTSDDAWVLGLRIDLAF